MMRVVEGLVGVCKIKSVLLVDEKRPNALGGVKNSSRDDI